MKNRIFFFQFVFLLLFVSNIFAVGPNTFFGIWKNNNNKVNLTIKIISNSEAQVIYNGKSSKILKYSICNAKEGPFPLIVINWQDKKNNNDMLYNISVMGIISFDKKVYCLKGILDVELVRNDEKIISEKIEDINLINIENH